jgi:AhpD family alkylhydroperoxidase
MSRQKIYNEIEDTLGLVPTFFQRLPDSSLELEWELFKKIEIEESSIPGKYRELMGLATSAAIRCRYCTFFHTEMAKLYGATEEEIDDALQYAKMVSGWSTFVNGLQLDFEQFKDEVTQACEHVRLSQHVTT